jgi:hypothetical protein
MKIKEWAPIVLFVYNRPEHTQKTIESLAQCIGADQTILYIYSDYAKNERALEGVKETRKYIRTVTGFQSVEIIEREENWGLARSEIAGVTEVVNKHGRVISMEDDLLSTKYLLVYLNEALERYKDDKHVFSVTGFSHFKNGCPKLPETYFLPVFSSLGWATWKDRWELFDAQVTGWEQLLTDEKMANEFDMDGVLDNSLTIKGLMQTHTIESWAIRAYWSMFKNHMVTLFTNRCLLEHFGNDGSGVHVAADDGYLMAELSDIPITNFPENSSVLPKATREFIKYKRKLKRNRKKERLLYYLRHPGLAAKKIISKG